MVYYQKGKYPKARRSVILQVNIWLHHHESIRSWMLPQDLDGVRELLDKTGVGDDFPRLSSIKLRSLLDETRAYINRYLG